MGFAWSGQTAEQDGYHETRQSRSVYLRNTNIQRRKEAEKVDACVLETRRVAIIRGQEDLWRGERERERSGVVEGFSPKLSFVL